MSYGRFVAIGDSTTEGLEDPYPDGRYRGWADRLAQRLAQDGPLLYANLAIRGRLARQVRAQQLAAAIALEPDLASVLAGLNDTLRRRYDADAVAGDLDAMIAGLRATGATVLAFTLPDPVPINPLARGAAPRVFALNREIRASAARHGALVVDMERSNVARDARLWHSDRLHGNPEGHRRVAAMAAEALGLPGADHSWDAPLPPAAAARRLERAAVDAAWAWSYFRPWLIRRLRGRSSGDGITAKRPALAPIAPER